MTDHKYQPDTTQRSIIAAARKYLERFIVVGTDLVRIPVARETGFITEAQALDGPQDWNKPHYIVTFRRNGQEWEAIKID